MKMIRLALALFVFIAVLCACGKRGGNANAAPAANTAAVPGEGADTARTNVEELAVLVNVPYEPDDVVWKEDAAHKRLTAVLHYSKADADRITADASERQAPQSVTIASEVWFPTEIVAQSEMSGDDALHGNSFDAKDFLMEPYNAGRVVRISDTDYFVLQLTAK